MARWDDENFNSQEPPKDTLCHTCIKRLKPVTVAGYTQDRSGYSSCDAYNPKPQDINWGRVPCPMYEREET